MWAHCSGGEQDTRRVKWRDDKSTTMIESRAGEGQPVMRCVTHTLNGEFDDDDDDDDDDDEHEGTPWLWITDLSFYLGGISRG